MRNTYLAVTLNGVKGLGWGLSQQPAVGAHPRFLAFGSV